MDFTEFLLGLFFLDHSGFCSIFFLIFYNKLLIFKIPDFNKIIVGFIDFGLFSHK
jgi:hypothetical protein